MCFPKSQDAAMEQSRNWRKGHSPGLASSLILSLRWAPAPPGVDASMACQGPRGPQTVSQEAPVPRAGGWGSCRNVPKRGSRRVPVSWGPDAPPPGLAEGTEGLCSPSSLLAPIFKSLGPPSRNPELAGEQSPRLCVMPRPGALAGSRASRRPHTWCMLAPSSGLAGDVPMCSGHRDSGPGKAGSWPPRRSVDQAACVGLGQGWCGPRGL